MRFLVVGASGLIGSAVARRLRQDGTVASLGRHAACALRADLSAPASLSGLDLSMYDAIVHCAGVVDEDFATPEKAFLQATVGAAALVASAANAGVRRFAYISSAHVYGPMIGEVDERTPADPRSDYAIAHYATEQILRRSSGQFTAAAVFRPCAVFGIPPSLRSFRRWGLIPFAFPRSAAADGKIVLRSSGEQRRNFVGTSDIADAIAIWMRRPAAAPFEIFNPVGVDSLSIWEFAQMVAAQCLARFGRDVQVKRKLPGPAPDPAASFEYRSVHDFCRGSASLDAYVAEALAASTQTAVESVV
jgi:UDP-glucose 4-epimerase